MVAFEVSILLWLACFAPRACQTAVTYPWINDGDLQVAGVTNQSVFLEWPPFAVVAASGLNVTQPLRLIIYLQVKGSNAVLYMNPPDDDPNCSLSLLSCYLDNLPPDTTFRVTVSIDEVKNLDSHQIGKATVEFATHPTPCPVTQLGNSNEWWLLYVVLPLAASWVVLCFLLFAVVVCHCRNKNKSQSDDCQPSSYEVAIPDRGSDGHTYQRSTTCTNNNVNHVSNETSCSYADPFYTPMDVNTSRNHFLFKSLANVERRTIAGMTRSASEDATYENDLLRQEASTSKTLGAQRYANTIEIGSNQNVSKINGPAVGQRPLSPPPKPRPEVPVYANESFPKASGFLR